MQNILWRKLGLWNPHVHPKGSWFCVLPAAYTSHFSAQKLDEKLRNSFPPAFMGKEVAKRYCLVAENGSKHLPLITCLGRLKKQLYVQRLLLGHGAGGMSFSTVDAWIAACSHTLVSTALRGTKTKIFLSSTSDRQSNHKQKNVFFHHIIQLSWNLGDCWVTLAEKWLTLKILQGLTVLMTLST